MSAQHGETEHEKRLVQMGEEGSSREEWSKGKKVSRGEAKRK